MLDAVFLQVLNMSYTASYVILAILFARGLLTKTPRTFSYALWGIALYRLICPWSFESALSLLSIGGRTTEQLRPFPEQPVAQGIIRGNIDTSAAGAIASVPPDMPKAPLLNNGFTLIWLVGIAVLLIYSVAMLLRLQKQLKGSARDTENIYLSAHLSTPFVMGVIRPKIYLPLLLSETEKRYILLHEQTHIRRFDHIIKLVSFFVLCVHWFNPLVWLAFFLSGRDMEMSCDETVIKKLGYDIKKEYAASLLSLSTGRRIIGGTPLAFGEGDTKSRIKNVLNYRKPAFWMIGAAIVGVAALWVGLAANPIQNETISVEFPAYTENGLTADETARFEVQLAFPQGWEIRQPAADNNQGVGYFSSSFLSELQIYQGNVFVGQMGFNSFEPYEDEIPAEDYYKTVYPQLRLGRMYTWDAYRPVHTTEFFEAAVAAVSYLDQAEIEKHPGAMPEVPVVEALGILAYDKSLKVYIGIQFAEDAVTAQQAEQMAKSIRLIRTEQPAAQEERVYFDNLSPEDETLYRQLTRQRGLKEWQIHSLTSLGYTFGDIIDLPETEIAAMLAPGSSFMGDRMTEDEFYKLIEAGILEKDVYVLQSLGYDYDAVIALTPEQLDFIFPNTELVDNLAALGYDRNIVEAAGFLHNGGWETYKELLDEVFTRYLHEQPSSEVEKENAA